MQEKKTILAVMGLELVASEGKAAILTTRPLIFLKYEFKFKYSINIQKSLGIDDKPDILYKDTMDSSKRADNSFTGKLVRRMADDSKTAVGAARCLAQSVSHKHKER